MPIPECTLKVFPGPCLPWLVHKLEKSGPEIQCSQRSVPGAKSFRFSKLLTGVGS